jgi:ABC-type nitrate/sulfonate/bicarbonate transport system ATPase subunit
MELSPTPVVALDGVAFRWDGDDDDLLGGISLSVEPGELVALLGPSGAGKSTVLRLVAGLLQPTAGTVELRGRTAMVFQDPRLLPWRTVAGNLDFALEAAGVPAADREARWRPLLEAVGLGGAAGLRPEALSGGMAQRVGVVRALALAPALLLLDEPFGALDPLLREDLQRSLSSLLAERGSAALLVTHDVQEAVTLADRVLVLGGRPARFVHEQGVSLPRPRDPADVWTPPGTAAVRELRGKLLAER